jgi:adenosylcobinamide-GDP ribazoletransferase
MGAGTVTGFVDAVGFLTRVPVGRRDTTAHAMAAAVPWFPVVGVVIALLEAGVFALARDPLTPLAAAALAVTAQLLLTGAFHEDGLADLADAAGGWSRQQRLAILDDPFHGTYGVLALVASFAVRTAALAALTAGRATGALVAAHGGGRGAAVLLMGLLPAAASTGLGASYLEPLRRSQAAAGVAAGAVAVVAGLGVGEGWSPAAAVVALVVAAVLAAAVGAYARRTLGGLTGDALGAAEQVAEAAILLVAVAAA